MLMDLSCGAVLPLIPVPEEGDEISVPAHSQQHHIPRALLLLLLLLLASSALCHLCRQLLSAER
jgi:hypothetical protein